MPPLPNPKILNCLKKLQEQYLIRCFIEEDYSPILNEGVENKQRFMVTLKLKLLQLLN